MLACADMCKTSVERGSAAGFLLTQLSLTLGWPVLMEGSPVPVPSHGTTARRLFQEMGVYWVSFGLDFPNGELLEDRSCVLFMSVFKLSA